MKVAPNIVNVVSSEQIQFFPDTNAAEATQRVPGLFIQRDQGEEHAHEGAELLLRQAGEELLGQHGRDQCAADAEVAGVDRAAAVQAERIERVEEVAQREQVIVGFLGNVLADGGGHVAVEVMAGLGVDLDQFAVFGIIDKECSGG